VTKTNSSLLQFALAAIITPVMLLLPDVSAAQSSPPYYINREHRFAVIFPGEPVGMDIRYTTSSGATVPARQFSVQSGTDLHAVTSSTSPLDPRRIPASSSMRPSNCAARARFVSNTPRTTIREFPAAS
jgi:hypothetical protein